MNKINIVSTLAIVFALALAAPACGGKKDDKKKTDDTAATDTKKPGDDTKKPAMSAAKAKIQAKKIFSTRCAQCHGESGKGDGAAAAALNPKPRNYTDKAWQESVTDDDLKKVIVQGGAAVGKAATMTANPDLGKPEMAPVLEQIVAQIREFAK